MSNVNIVCNTNIDHILKVDCFSLIINKYTKKLVSWKKNYAFAPRMRDRSQTGAAAEVTLLIFGSMHVQQSNQSLFTIARPRVNRGC